MIEEQALQNQSQQVPERYAVATEDVPPELIPQAVRLPLAFQNTPTQVCGMAHRVGYLPVAQGKQALYRLKVHMRFASRKTATLPGFYLLEHGAFVEYVPTNMPPHNGH